jgi:hypothetical protein
VTQVLHWIYVNHVMVWVALGAIAKWSYNAGAFKDGVTFRQFLRGFLGEVIQEAPPPPLTAEQQKLLTDAGKPAVE